MDMETRPFVWSEYLEPDSSDTKVTQFCSDRSLIIADRSNEYVSRLVSVVLAILSMMGLITVALTIFYNKKLRQHPSPLIAYICIVEAINCWSSLLRFLKTSTIICYFNLYTIFDYTRFKNPKDCSKDQVQFETFLMLQWSNILLNNFFELLSLGLNTCLCIDLVLTLWSPFEVASRRMTFYQLSSVIGSFLLTLIMWFAEDKDQY